MRDIETIDAELRLLAVFRSACARMACRCDRRGRLIGCLMSDFAYLLSRAKW